MKHVVDAHGLIWFLANNPRLGVNADSILSNPASELILPATALAEVCWVVERQPVGLTVSDVLRALDGDGRISVYPLNRSVIEKSNGLHAINEMHDRQIVATALVLIDEGNSVSLITHDANIAASALVLIVW
jgi:PIN domain nuclease of toxin-antitoxin system